MFEKKYQACFRKIRAKLVVFYEFLILNLAILTNFERKVGIYLAFFHFSGFGLLNFFGPGNPV